MLKIFLITMGFLTLQINSHTYEFVLDPNQKACVGDHFAKGSFAGIEIRTRKVGDEGFKVALIETLQLRESPVEELKAKKANVKLEFTADTGELLLAYYEQFKKYPIEMAQDQYVQFCFMNKETAHQSIVIFDLRSGYHTADIKHLPTKTDRHQIVDKLEKLRVNLDHDLRMYKQMEAHEEDWAKKAEGVLSTMTYFGAVMLLAIIIVTWGTALVIEKGINERKNK